MYDYMDLSEYIDYADNVNWNKLKGNEIAFEYKERKDVLRVMDYEKYRGIVNIIYADRYYAITEQEFLRGDLSSIPPLQFKYFVGDKVETVIQTFTIEAARQGQERVYSCRCDKCNCISELTEAALDKRHTCNYCRGFKLLAGENDLAITHPEIAVMLKNKELYRELNRNSDTYTDWICPCGLEIFHKQVKSVVKHGLSCIYCGNYSFGAKYLYSVLWQLDLDVAYEYSPHWARGKRYDLYVASDSLIVEVHGLHHYQDVYAENTHEVNAINDTFKREMAIEVGIQRYVELDCRYSDHKWIEKQVRQSELASYYDLNKVDFRLCLLFAIGKLGEWICHLWANGFTLSEIENQTKANRTHIRTTLIRGTYLNLCHYSAEEGAQRGRDTMKRSIVLMNTGEEFKGIRETAKAFGLNPKALANACAKGDYLGYDNKTGEMYQWAYAEDYTCGVHIVKQQFHKDLCSVVCADTEEIFATVVEAAEVYGIQNYLHILDVCDGKRRFAGKHPQTRQPLSWLYLEDFEGDLRENQRVYGGGF